MLLSRLLSPMSVQEILLPLKMIRILVLIVGFVGMIVDISVSMVRSYLVSCLLIIVLCSMEL